MGHPATQLIGRRIGMVPGELTPFGFYANDVFINLIFFTFSKFCAMSDMYVLLLKSIYNALTRNRNRIHSVFL